MIFGQILKNVLDKNQSVFIPTVGLLGYDKATSKLGLDVYGSGSDSDLIHLIADIKQISHGEARGILIQEIESLKSTVFSQGKYNIEGLGEILFSNGSFQFESKKALFPTDFFSGSNFNSAVFQDNTKKEDANIFSSTFIKVETTKVESKKPETTVIDNKISSVETTNEFSPIIEPPKDLFEAAQIEAEQTQKPKSLLDNVKDFFSSSSKKIENKIEETTENIEELLEDTKESVEQQWNEAVQMVENKVEEIADDADSTPSIDYNVPPVVEEDFTTKILNEITQDETELDIEEDELDQIEEEQIEQTQEEKIEIAPPVIEEPKKIVLDEPRRNIGNARYDEGYYDYDLTLESEKPNRWPMVAGLSALLIGGGFMAAWIIASYQGKHLGSLAPLWNTKKEDVKKAKPIAIQKDTTVLDTALMANQANTPNNVLKDSSLNKSNNPTTISQTNTQNKAVTPIPEKTSKITSTQPTQTNQKNTTTPKTPLSSDPVSKKSVAVATDKNKNQEVKSSAKDAASISATKDPQDVAKNKVKDTTKKTIAKLEKVNVVGKPYATANYTKGNYYLSFGKFKIATAAVKLKNDMKKKAGIETDIILLDGTYRVVVPYLSKEKAEAASRDYVSTTLFE